MRVRSLIAVALAACAWVVPAVALADTSVAVLGIQSIEGDEQAAAQITAAIRVGVGTISGYDLLASDATLAQMILAHDCSDEPDDACLTNIAGALEAQRLVFGQLRRVSVARDYRFQLTLTVFNRETSHTERTLRLAVDRTATSDALREVGRTAARQLLGVSATGGGTIVVTSSVLAATVQLDGQTVGQTSDDPLVLRGVPAGRHQIAVTSAGRRAYTRAVSVDEGESVTVTAELPVLTGPTPYDGGRGPGPDDTSGGSDLRWIGWVSIGVGVVAGAVALWSYLEWSSTGRGDEESASLFDEYTGAACSESMGDCQQSSRSFEIEDVCTFAEEHPGVAVGTRDQVLDLCSEGDGFQVIQIASMAVGVVALTAGVIGIMTLGPDDSPEASDRAARLRHRASLVPRLSPILSERTAGLSARLTF